jgi:hypothetical protein
MANPDAPFGFKVWNAGGGGTPCRTEEGTLVAAYGTALYSGDALTLAADGTLAVATAGGAIIGIFDGVEYILPDGSVKIDDYWPASTATKSGSKIRVTYIPVEGHIFYAQSAGSMTLADVGQWVDISTGTAGSAVTGRSGMQTSATGGSEVSFAIVGVLGAAPYDGDRSRPCRNAAGNPDMYTTGANAVVLVKVAKHVGGQVAAVEV